MGIHTFLHIFGQLQYIVYIKRNKIYDKSENLNNAQIAEYDKLDKIFVIMLLITIGLVGVAAYVIRLVLIFDIYEEFYINFFLSTYLLMFWDGLIFLKCHGL